MPPSAGLTLVPALRRFAENQHAEIQKANHQRAAAQVRARANKGIQTGADVIETGRDGCRAPQAQGCHDFRFDQRHWMAGALRPRGHRGRAKETA